MACSFFVLERRSVLAGCDFEVVERWEEAAVGPKARQRLGNGGSLDV